MKCERCGRTAELAPASFRWHVGLLLLAVSGEYRGRFCKPCAHNRAAWASGLTGLTGWWWPLGAVVVPLILLGNLWSWMRLPKQTDPTGPPPDTPQKDVAARPMDFGPIAVVAALWPLLHFVVLAVALGFLANLIVVSSPQVGIGLLGEAAPPSADAVDPSIMGYAFFVDALLTFTIVTTLLIAVRRVAPGTKGRSRLASLGLATLVRTLSTIVLGLLVASAFRDPTWVFLELSSPTGVFASENLRMFASISAGQGSYTILITTVAVGVLADLIALGCSIYAWFLLPERVRAIVWGVIDILLLVSVVLIFVLGIPDRPPPDHPEWILLPLIRLIIFAIAGIRLFFRLMPLTLDAIERGAYQFLVAARMLRAKKSGFLNAIGALSVLGILVSTTSMIAVLSIMGGFRHDLKDKILGNHAHIVVDREHGTFGGWQQTLTAVRAQPHVTGATPYLETEVMITSATNLHGAMLRGIDPASIGDVTDLPSNLQHGDIDYLSHPERLLRLRAEDMRRGLLAPSPTLSPRVPPPEGRNSLTDDLQEILGGVDPEANRVRSEIDELLGPDDYVPSNQAGSGASDDEEGATDESVRDVLPGLIVGRETARNLRLHLGDEVNVISPRGDLGPAGMIPRSRPFRIAGIFHSGMYEYDSQVIYTTLEEAQSFIRAGDEVTGIEIKVAQFDNAEAYANAIEREVDRPELRVRAWQEVNRRLFGALALEKLTMFIVLSIAVLVAGFCIVGFLTLMVQEKRKEVGILRAMGARAGAIVAVFMGEGAMLGLAGATLGLWLGWVATFGLKYIGFPLDPEIYYIDRLPVHLDPTEFLAVWVSAVVVSLIATVYPAILGSRMRPVEAMRDT